MTKEDCCLFRAESFLFALFEKIFYTECKIALEKLTYRVKRLFHGEG